MKNLSLLTAGRKYTLIGTPSEACHKYLAGFLKYVSFHFAYFCYFVIFSLQLILYDKQASTRASFLRVHGLCCLWVEIYFPNLFP